VRQGLPSLPPRRGVRRRLGTAAGAAALLGTPVGAAVTLQRHHPGLVLGVSLLELAALAWLVGTGSVVSFAVLLAASAALATAVATNRRQVLAVTGMGTVVLTASITGWPNGIVGPAERALELPPPSGLGARVSIGGRTWWIDRSSFASLRRARTMLRPGADAGEP
jgi:hypothetical protein